MRPATLPNAADLDRAVDTRKEPIMGVNCKITIPAPAQLRDVADVLGIMLGCPVSRQQLDRTNASYAKVEGISFHRHDTPSGIDLTVPECVQIIINAPDGQHWFLYHFEWDAFGNHGIMPRSYAEAIALGVGLVDFFGGVVDYHDCDDSHEDYRQPVREDIHAEDGQPWQHFQDRKLTVQPLTPRDIERYRQYASYQDER